MRYQYVGHGVEFTPALKDYALKRVSKMEKYFSDNDDVKCTITISLIKHYQIAEISIKAADMYLRAKVSNEKDLYGAIDLCVDKLEGQMRKVKTQILKLQKRNSFGRDILIENIKDDIANQEIVPISKIVKRKNLTLTPMDADEALARMEALDHSFFIYLDSTTQKPSILYRRQDNTLGLIEIDN